MDKQENFLQIINMIENARNNAIKKVNEELINLYWNVGKYISERTLNSEWGDSIVKQLADYIKKEKPEIKGFNRPGLYRMKQFYETYKENEFVSTVLRQISWSSHLKILSGTKTMEEKEFYMELCIKEKYSFRELERQIDSSYYQRYVLSDKSLQPENVKNKYEKEVKLLDSYTFEFLNLLDNYSEKDLRKAIIKNIKKFVLEIGRDFTFVG